MNKILYLLLIFISFSCQPEQSNPQQIPLFNELTFNLLDDEKLVELNDTIKESYFNFSTPDIMQIPLFRYIQGNDYHIYIGLPYRTSLKKIATSIELAQHNTLFESSTTNEQSYFKRYSNNDNYCSEYTVKIGSNTIYILAVTSSINFSETQLNQKMIAKRLIENGSLTNK